MTLIFDLPILKKNKNVNKIIRFNININKNFAKKLKKSKSQKLSKFSKTFKSKNYQKIKI